MQYVEKSIHEQETDLLRIAVRRARIAPRIERVPVENPINIELRNALEVAQNEAKAQKAKNLLQDIYIAELQVEIKKLRDLVNSYKASIPQQIEVTETIRSERCHPSVADIKKLVCKKYCVSHSELVGPRRSAGYARPRQIACYLVCKLTPFSFNFIAKQFGGRNHTTILHAFKSIQARRDQCNELDIEIGLLEAELMAPYREKENDGPEPADTTIDKQPLSDCGSVPGSDAEIHTMAE